MKTKLSNILIAIQALAAVVMVAALKIWGMGCAAAVVISSLIDLVSGKEGQVPG